MMVCDMCSRKALCVRRTIEDTDYDICDKCWKPIEEKLAGKGRVRSKEPTFIVPHPQIVFEQPTIDVKPLPGVRPKIF